MTEAQDCLVREIMSQISEKWTLWTMSVLSENGGPMRFSRIMEAVEGVSQKSLTKTLRQLERTGFVTREVFAEVPPRVEYRITSLGDELLAQLHPVWMWTAAHIAHFEAARQATANHKEKTPWLTPRVPVLQA